MLYIKTLGISSILTNFLADENAQYATYSSININDLPAYKFTDILNWLGITNLNSTNEWLHAARTWYRACLSSAVFLAALASVSTLDWTSQNFQQMLVDIIRQDPIAGSQGLFQPPESVRTSFWNIFVEYLCEKTKLLAEHVVIPDILALLGEKGSGPQTNIYSQNDVASESNQGDELSDLKIEQTQTNFAISLSSSPNCNNDTERLLDRAQIIQDNDKKTQQMKKFNSYNSLSASFRCIEVSPYQKEESDLIMLAINNKQGLTTVGLLMWPAGQLLADYLLVNQSTFQNKRCLELGAGAGLASILLHRAGAQHVLTSDAHPKVVSYLRANLWLNGATSMLFPDAEEVLVNGILSNQQTSIINNQNSTLAIIDKQNEKDKDVNEKTSLSSRLINGYFTTNGTSSMESDLVKPNVADNISLEKKELSDHLFNFQEQKNESYAHEFLWQHLTPNTPILQAYRPEIIVTSDTIYRSDLHKPLAQAIHACLLAAVASSEEARSASIYRPVENAYVLSAQPVRNEKDFEHYLTILTEQGLQYEELAFGAHWTANVREKEEGKNKHLMENCLFYLIQKAQNLDLELLGLEVPDVPVRLHLITLLDKEKVRL